MDIKDLEDKIKEAETVYEIVKCVDEFVGADNIMVDFRWWDYKVCIYYSYTSIDIDVFNDNFRLHKQLNIPDYGDAWAVVPRLSNKITIKAKKIMNLEQKLDDNKDKIDKYSQEAIKSSFERNFISEQLLSVEEQMQKEIESVKQKYESKIEDLKDRIQEIDQDHYEIAERMFRIPESELLELEQLKEDLGL